MANYFLTNKAVEDLSEIWEYTFQTWSEAQADKYYKQLLDLCKMISADPQIGKVYDQIDTTILGHRASHHIIFYRINFGEVEILRILHGRMDLKNRLQE